MKNKKFIYILLPLVLIIWGIIIYKIFFYTNIQEGNYNTSLSNQKPIKTTVIEEIDTFVLLLNYSDPFLKYERRVNHVSINNFSNKKSEYSKAYKEPEAIAWPTLNYGGLIKRINEAGSLAILNINGHSQLMRIGETIEDVKLLKVYNDSIIVSYKKQVRTIIKK